MMDSASAQKVLAEVLALAKRAAPGSEVTAALESGRTANTRYARNEITSTGDVDETTVWVEVALGQRHASTSTNQLDPSSLAATAQRAARMAKIAPEDPEYVPVLGPQRYVSAAPEYDLPTEKLDAKVRAQAAREAIGAAERAKVEVAGFYEHAAKARAKATSAGLHAFHRSSRAELTTTARTPDGTGSGWAGALSHRASEIQPASVANVAIQKAARSAKPRRLEPSRYTVILEPAAVAELLMFFDWSLFAREADEGRSFFAKAGGGTRVGERLFGENITLTSDPSDSALPTAPFDYEGFPLRKTEWVRKGLLTSLIYSRYWARKQGKTPTGMPAGFHLAGGQAASTPDLLAGVKRGVLITRFWYTEMLDPQAILATGLTRDGVFLVENGEVVGPVNNFRFNESPVTMLKNADALTRQTVCVPGLGHRLRVPALRTHEFNLASVSEAV